MDAKMVDMKRDAPDDESGATAIPADSEGAQYPWGLQIRLESEDLEKLGIPFIPATGAEIMGHFAGVVTATSQDADGKHKSMSIQICGLCLMAEEPESEQEKSESKEQMGVYRPMGKPKTIVE